MIVHVNWLVNHSAIDQSETSVIDKKKMHRWKSLASKCVKIFEILKINLRIFEFEFDFGMAGLLMFENMVIWTEIEGFIGL